MLPLLLLGCQEPFGHDRHDLVGFRVAALASEEVDGGRRPRAALIVDGHPWSDEPVDLRWFVLPGDAAEDELSAISTADEPDGTGPLAVLDADPADRIGLLAIAPDGTEERAFVDVPADRAAEILGLLLDEPHVPVGGTGRLGALTVAMDDTPRVRWMATAGTFVEVDRVTTDWIAGDAELDEGEIIRGDDLPAGIVTVVAFLVGGDGGNDFAAVEVHVGPPGTGVRTRSGRWLPTDVAVSGVYVGGTLRADDASPVGLRLEDAVDVDPSSLPASDPFGTDALPCEGVVGPFDPDWLLDGRCLRAPLDGASVVVEIAP